jgi:RNA polymerase sigma-70 factor, ECF subfamily
MTHLEPPPPTLPTDWDLVTQAQDGDTGAFAVLYDRHVSTVFRYVLARVRDHALAEDVVSETFTRVFRALPRLSDRGPFPGVLVTTARNMMTDHFKSSYFQLTHPTAEIWDVGIPGQRADNDPASEVTGRDTQRWLEGQLGVLVGGLSPDQQEVVRLRFYAGLSVAATAVVMGRGEGAVKALQHRAVTTLAGRLPRGVREALYV